MKSINRIYINVLKQLTNWESGANYESYMENNPITDNRPDYFLFDGRSYKGK